MTTCKQRREANLVVHLVLACAFLCGMQAKAQEAPDGTSQSGRNKTLNMVRTQTPPIIDGVMDDIWASGSVIEDLHQVNPVEYAEPSEKTTIRVLYDDDFLYISGMMYYSDTSQIVANKLIQGSNLRTEDKLRVYINPFNDGRNGYLFQTNANGVRTDGIIENVTSLNFDWTGIWYAGSKRTDYGWFGEIAIPFKTISFDPNSDSWGLSILRSVQAKTETMAWTSYNRSINPTNYGTAVGLTNLQQGWGLDVIPGASVTRIRGYNPSFSDTEFDPTLDVFYKFTPNLTGALTLNSDFSATDVDARQVQLSRFSLFFPEQRKFFLQEADIFEFGGLQQNGKPFFSRRIGIAPGGAQLDLDVGGKLTGRVGRWNVGALAVQQSGNATISDSELFVGRVAANVLDQSTVGAIVTHGNPLSDVDNNLVGVDFNYLNTRSFENVTIDGQLWYQQSDTDGLDGNDNSWGVKLRSPNQNGFKGRVQYTSIGENFFPALGFVNRRGIRQSEIGFGYIKRYGGGSKLRSLDNFAELIRVTDSNGNVESELFELSFLKIENQSGDIASLLYTDNREVLTTPFAITQNVTIPIGDYSYQRYGVNLETGGQRKVIATLRLENGGFFSGHRKTANVKLEWQPGRHFLGALEYEYNDISLLEGNFDTRLIRLRTDVAFNAEWAWVTTAQYDNQSELLGVNSRLQWIPKAGQEFYLIYNGGWVDQNSSGFDRVGQSATAKVSYTFRF